MKKLDICILFLLIACNSIIISAQSEDYAQSILDRMSLDEKLAQMLLIDFRNWKLATDNEPKPIEHMNNEIKSLLEKYHIGSIILSSGNLSNTQNGRNSN